MSKLVVTRKSEFINRRQRFKVFIDGKEMGAVPNDGTQEFDLDAGIYVVQCKLRWMSSPGYTATLTEGKNVYLKTGNGMRFFLPLYILMLAGLFLPGILVLAKQVIPNWADTFRIIAVLPALVYIILYMSVFRKKYLFLEEDKSNPFG